MLSPKQAGIDVDARALAERDRKLGLLKPELVEKGEVDGDPHAARKHKEREQEALLAGAPNYVIDLAITCHKHGCGAPLTALSYVAMINDASNPVPRFMLWIEGQCPQCMVKRKTIFDPLAGMQAQGKLVAENDALWKTWREEAEAVDGEDAHEVAEVA